MAHTLLCGQRRYTMPAIVIPTGSTFLGLLNIFTFTTLKVTNIRPPGGIVVSGGIGAPIQPSILKITTEKDVVYIFTPTVPTLLLSNSVIQSIELGEAAPGYLSWWQIADVSYLTEVREAYNG